MKAILFAVLAGLAWGVGEVCTKAALHTGKFGPMTALLVRGLGAIVPIVIAYLVASSVLKTEPANWWQADRRSLMLLVVGSALLAGFAGVFFFYLGLAHGAISTVKPIAFSVAPATGVLLGWMVLKEPLPPIKLAGIALVILGVVLVTAQFGAGPTAAGGVTAPSAEPSDPAR